jgi:hypothetical protein
MARARALLTLLACSAEAPTTVLDPSICQQTFEFGNFGCARIAGVLTGTAGQPVRFAHVVLNPRPEDSGVYTVPTALTSSAGEYALEVQIMHPGPVVGDTLTMVFSYAYRPGSESFVSGSVPVTVRFAHVGQPAWVTGLDLSVPVPP